MSTRSYQGCWTCKRRRRRCDNVRPACRNCAHRGTDCEGYEVRLRWGSGIASRGRFTGADKPLEENVPPRPKGRRRDLSRERKRLEAETQAQRAVDFHEMIAQLEEVSPKTDRSEHDEMLFNEFLTNGMNILHSTGAPHSMLQSRLPELCQESSALYNICLTFQLSLSATHTPQFFEYFDTSLREFRSELARSTTLSDGTLTAGLLMCSIGLMHGMPWTMHIEGMHNILQSRIQDSPRGISTPTPFRAHLLEVMGLMDLPCFTVGRQTRPIGIWRRFCQPTGPRNGIEPMTGLPRDLLDLLAGIDLDTTEQNFWDWPGEAGSFLQCYLWEAYRLAGILTIRQSERLQKAVSGSPRNLSTWRRSNSCPIDSSMLVARVLANVDALRLGCLERPDENPFIKNSILFPIVVAGMEATIMRQNPQWQKVIRGCSLGSRQDDILLDLLEEVWQRGDSTLDINELARARGVEMGLL
ncbi:C6 finger domain protein [Penicillium brasilianum]|uniref:C6 finger domain protein n=1 Tax=Penicillium brasilianum TaxID=104259 RepID=A0A1S9RH14_PENBI|nr:C6 finger domain protein [Penicillium brasilianum]